MAGKFLGHSIIISNKLKTLLLLFGLGWAIILLSDCNNLNVDAEFLNHSDTVDYIGMDQCGTCHSDKLSTFVHTGMGQSFDHASKNKSSAIFGAGHVVHDSFNNLSYYPFWKDSHLFIREFRIVNRDTVHKLEVKIDYIVGSGQHTNSHLFKQGQYLFQAPLTFYVQKQKWDLPPGFENNNNSRFNRILNVECLSCHNSMPKMTKGSEYSFESIGTGIDCERCHGPGELHRNIRAAGKGVDASKEIDRTIVNPGKLSWERQIDVCQRCHLQGLNVLKPGKAFTDFIPGMTLSNIFEIYLPEYEGAEGKFDMANHADRFQRSQCFIKSNKEQMDFTCISCHNPHVSVQHTSTNVFNSVCSNCHQDRGCTELKSVRNNVGNNCVQCHMPQRGSEDIPHVSVHDHFIQKPLKTNEAEKIRKLVGLYAVNNTNPNAYTKTLAYLDYYEKFDKNPLFIQKAKALLSQNEYDDLWLRYYYIIDDFRSVVSHYQKKGIELDAWLAYIVGESYENIGKLSSAQELMKLSIKLDPQNPLVRKQLLRVSINRGDMQYALSLGNQLREELPLDVEIANAVAEIHLKMGDLDSGKKSMDMAMSLGPNNMKVWETHLNYYLMTDNKRKALEWANKLIKANPNHPAKELLQTLVQ